MFFGTRKESEMLQQFFITQCNRPFKWDSTETVQENLDEFGLPIDLNYIKLKSTEAYQNIVVSKTIKHALKLLRMKQNTHIKKNNFNYNDKKTFPYQVL